MGQYQAENGPMYHFRFGASNISDSLEIMSSIYISWTGFVSEITIRTKPLARRTLSRVRRSAVVEGWDKLGRRKRRSLWRRTCR